MILIVTIIFYKRLSIRESVKLPLQVYTLDHYIYLGLVFILLLVAIISFIIFRYKIVLDRTFDVIFEYVKQRFEFITIYLDKKYLNINEIYRYFGYHKKSLIRIYFLLNWCPRIIVATVLLCGDAKISCIASIGQLTTDDANFGEYQKSKQNLLEEKLS